MSVSKNEAARIAYRAFMEKQYFSPEEQELRIRQASDPEYWRKLNPQLSVGDFSSEDIEAEPFSEQRTAAMLAKLKKEGYFSSQIPLIKKELCDKMLQGVENLRKAGWHEVWSFVYDEFWAVLRTPSLLKLLPQTLGEGYKAMPHAVVHYVHPETGAGWSPHVDFSSRDDRFTVWMPISEATIDNGCMYAIAQNRVSPELLQKWINMEDLSHREIKVLLQASRALPIEAGGVLAWESKVIHWGTMSSANVQPRVSLSVVYLRENITPHPDEIPLLLPEARPTYAQKMLTVAKAIGYYKAHVLALHKYIEMATKIETMYRSQAEEEAGIKK
ncbi:MAG: phytanoyl-CoA dioxygenase family protein [Flavobacteriales bacterium]